MYEINTFEKNKLLHQLSNRTSLPKQIWEMIFAITEENEIYDMEINAENEWRFNEDHIPDDWNTEEEAYLNMMRKEVLEYWGD